MIFKALPSVEGGGGMAWRTLRGIQAEGMDLSDSSGVYINFGSLL